MLKHSIQIQEHLTLPIGVHSEEALEGLNKEIRNACLYHKAKISRWSDLIHSFQVSIHFINHREYEGKELPNIMKCLLD